METSVIGPLLVYALLGFLISWSLIPRIQKWTLKRRENRLFHQTQNPVSRLGGIALATSFIAVVITAKLFLGRKPIEHNEWVIIISALAMFGVGLWDDFQPLGARIKLGAQILIASGVYFAGVGIRNFTNPLTYETMSFGLGGYIATVFWLVALTNLINLIDGIDGLAGGISFMLMCLLVYVSVGQQDFSFLIAIGMAGALMGFIWFNFPPAKIYMGDGGAYFLGFLIGLLTIENSQKGTVAAALVAPIFALALPILDVSLAIVRRGVKGLPFFRPDRKHIHHQLVASGFSHRRTVLTLYALSLVFSLMAFGVFWSQGRLVPILVGFLFLTVVVSARSLGFLRDWFAVGEFVGVTLRVRKETRYALCLSRWLELEAERVATIQELCAGLAFIAHKLGFQQMQLVLDEGALVWSREQSPAGGDWLRQRHEMRIGNMIALELACDPSAMPAQVFDQLGELTAEAWMKAVARWQSIHGRPIQLDAAMSFSAKDWEAAPSFGSGIALGKSG